jgi:hypothetical protein
MKHEWNIQSLKLGMNEDLKQCHTELEIEMCKTINIKQIFETAQKIKKSRKFNAGEIAILQELNNYFLT